MIFLDDTPVSRIVIIPPSYEIILRDFYELRVAVDDGTKKLLRMVRTKYEPSQDFIEDFRKQTVAKFREKLNDKAI